MTGEELYERILTAGPPSADLQVLLSFKQENGGHYHRRLPMSQRLTEHFQAFLSGFLQAQRGKLQRGTTRILGHDPAYKPDKNEITWAENDDVPFLAAFLDGLPDPHEIDAYDSEDEGLLQTMSFFTIETRLADDSDLRAFCRITKSKEITRGGIKRIPITWVTNRFDTLEDTTLVFEPRFFAFEYEEHMFILTQHYLEQAFGYIERIRNVAEAALNEIEEKVPIANFGEFREINSRSNRR